MSSSWDSPGPKSKVVDTHYHVVYFYGFLSALFALGLFLGRDKGIPYEHVAILAVLVALTVGHFKVSNAAENGKEWVPAASMVLAIPLLVGFPIGTFLGVKLLINASRLKPTQ